jgi:autoinducer 2-degrading protein
MSRFAVVARVRVHEGKADEYLAAFGPLIDAANEEPGTLLYTVQRSSEDPQLFWTTEVYADANAFDAHRGTAAHQAANPVFSELIADADVIMGEPVLGKGLPS